MPEKIPMNSLAVRNKVKKKKQNKDIIGQEVVTTNREELAIHCYQRHKECLR